MTVTQLPNTKVVTIGGLTLNLRLNGKAIITIEKRLGKSLMSLFLNGNGGMQIPATNELLVVLQGANTKHSISDKDLVDAFEKFIDEGHTTIELLETVQGLLEDAGFFGEKKEGSQTDSESEQVTLDSEAAEETIL